MDYYIDERPWGWFKILLDSPNHKVKEMMIKPKSRFSYQLHKKRNEHWVVVSGSAVAIVDGKENYLEKGDSISVPIGAKHRMENRTDKDLIFIEVQTGDYFGEEDIIRFEDDYNRI